MPPPRRIVLKLLFCQLLTFSKSALSLAIPKITAGGKSRSPLFVSQETAPAAPLERKIIAAPISATAAKMRKMSFSWFYFCSEAKRKRRAGVVF